MSRRRSYLYSLRQSRLRSLLRQRLSWAALSAILALLGASGCGPDPEDGGGCGFLGACQGYEGGQAVATCCEIDLCSASLEVRLSCCACDPSEFCAPDVPCNLASEPFPETPGSTCMACHNGASFENYSGVGLQNPHPFPDARFIACVTCHGGDPTAEAREDAHIPAPIEIGEILDVAFDLQRYEYWRTHTGVDALPDYEVNGQVFESIDWLQFVNPGAMPVVERGRGCAAAGCHEQTGAWLISSVMTTAAGISSALMDHSGVEGAVVESLAWYGNTAADYGFRAAVDPAFMGPGDIYGQVEQVLQLPEKAALLDPGGIHQNPVYNAGETADDVVAASDGTVHANQLITGSPLHDLLIAGATQACGQCHLGDSGGNRSAGEMRSSGCSACHMSYGLSGRAVYPRDPNIPEFEPANPDLIAAPETPHPRSHRIVSSAKVFESGDVLLGVEDQACGTCHRETNDIALEFWGLRVDEQEDVTNNLQYPANPNVFQNAANEPRLFAPELQNQTYQGYAVNQLLTFEDYDADGLNDIPADVHYEAGLSCIDCHIGSDVHNGSSGDPQSGALMSRAEQAVSITCEGCHGGVELYAATTACVDTRGDQSECALDGRGNPLPHVIRDDDGHFWLFSRVKGRQHYLPQTRDVVVDSGLLNPLDNQPVYSAEASYAMGRADGDPATGLGPLQNDPTLVTDGFSHSDRMDCVSCHAAWTNHQFAEYFGVRYRDDPQNPVFSTVDARPVSIASDRAQAIYASPLPFFLGVGNRGRITQTGPELQLFFQLERDLNGESSQVFAFTDRRGDGNNPGYDGRGPFGALGHGRVMAHTIRGAVDANSEGARQCVACHLNSAQITDYGADYQAFLTALSSGDLNSLDFALLQEQIGQNTGNENNSPFFVHMAVGLGSGLWYFDASGCPVNPLDLSDGRVTCAGRAPFNEFDPANIAFALDQPVTPAGVANASGHRPAASAAAGADIAPLRDGAHNPDMPGPLGATLTERLADPNTGLILDSWLDSNGRPRGLAEQFL